MDSKADKTSRRSRSRSSSGGRKQERTKSQRKVSRSSSSSRSGSRRGSRSRDSSIEERRRLRRENRRSSRSSSRERFIRNRQRTRQWLTKSGATRQRLGGQRNRRSPYQNRFRNQRRFRNDLPRNPSPLRQPFRFGRHRSPGRNDEGRRPQRSSRDRSGSKESTTGRSFQDSHKPRDIDIHDATMIGIESVYTRQEDVAMRTKSQQKETRVEVNLIDSTTPDVNILANQKMIAETSDGSESPSSTDSSSSEERKKKKKKHKKEKKRKRKKSKKREDGRKSSKKNEERSKSKRKGPSKEAEELLKLIGDPICLIESNPERSRELRVKTNLDSESDGYSSSSRNKRFRKSI